jgi:hypothetical protein
VARRQFAVMAHAQDQTPFPTGRALGGGGGGKPPLQGDGARQAAAAGNSTAIVLKLLLPRCRPAHLHTLRVQPPSCCRQQACAALHCDDAVLLCSGHHGSTAGEACVCALGWCSSSHTSSLATCAHAVVAGQQRLRSPVALRCCCCLLLTRAAAGAPQATGLMHMDGLGGLRGW